MNKLIILTLILLLASPVVLQARSWYVSPDGTGDYEVIQHAVDASSVGDTIMIGAGRYKDFTPALGVHWMVVVNVTVDSLTFRGVDRDSVFIGYEDDEWDNGFNGSPEYLAFASDLVDYPELWLTTVTFEDMTIENSSSGIKIFPSADIKGCIFRNHDRSGILIYGDFDGVVENCQVYNVFSGTAIKLIPFMSQAAGHGVVRNCLVDSERTPDNQIVGMRLESYNLRAENCIMKQIGVSYSGLASNLWGEVFLDNCVADSSYTGLWHDRSMNIFNVNNCSIINTTTSGISTAQCWIVGENNLFTMSEGSSGKLYNHWNGIVEINNSHFIKGDAAYSTYIASAEPDMANYIDLRNNYWGTSREDSIQAWIWDGNDDPEIDVVVLYNPYHKEPLFTGVNGEAPEILTFDSVYPNPFNPSTTIAFTLNISSHVRLAIYAIDGSLVMNLANRVMDQGGYSFVWDGRNSSGQTVSSGTYIARLTTANESRTKKMMLIR